VGHAGHARLQIPDVGVRVLSGHGLWVNSVDVAPDGSIVTGSGDKTARVWDPRTGECRNTLEHDYEVKFVKVARDGTLFTGGTDGTIDRWELKSGERLKPITGLGWLTAMTLTSDGALATATHKAGIALRDPTTGECLQKFDERSEYIRHICALSKGTIVTASGEAIKLWDPKTGKCQQTIKCKYVLNWERKPGQQVRTHQDDINSIAVGPGDTILTGSSDGYAILWRPVS
jgi:WD40 repeat protein